MSTFSLMKEFANIHEQIKKAQFEIEKVEASGSSGGNMVQITLNGKFDILDIKLDPVCVDNRDVGMLEDLIKAAHRDAMEKIQEKLKNRVGAMVSGAQQ